MSQAHESGRPCPVCGIAVSEDCIYRPFCSKRCQQIDLGRWAGGDYRMPDNDSTPWETDDDTEFRG